ncbi:hypothetical protein [Lentibacillus sp. Marseille-P4043]|uniref:hypothetical protein n=1 Tax=Lentibacillus sp. Marseille-P4043 TaxID=2040293 RepID=UPI00131A57EE|nr:hypothetical protein [Lentibacillus sp. Marseille-P4043]
MKDQNVRHAHVEMALQQLTLMEMYEALMKRMGWSFTPRVSTQDQVNTYQHFYQTFNR